MTLKEIVDNISNIAQRYVPTDDRRLHPKQIGFWVDQYRSFYLMESTEFGKDIHPWLYQDMGILELEEVDKSECSNVTTGCEIMKYSGIPQPVEFPKQRGYNAYLVDKQTPIDHIDHKNAHFSTMSRFDCALSWFYTIGDTLYVESQKNIQYINFRGVFNKPREVEKFCAKNNTKPCRDDLDFEYPVDDKLLSKINRSILQNEFNLGYKMPADVENNSDSTT